MEFYNRKWNYFRVFDYMFYCVYFNENRKNSNLFVVREGNKMKSEAEIKKRLEMYQAKKRDLKDMKFQAIVAAGIYELKWVLDLL
jgi:hypothetical protein